MKAQSIGAGQFKARCLALIDQVATTRREIVITKRGRPIAKLAPLAAVEKDLSNEPLIAFQGDLVSPLDVDWEAAR